ncbi:Nucleoside diphosphate-linked moiety X motif 17 [Chionoecetes opilio]|uniref:m7GpppN-mRNA hydrolase NUDT17 n=1 Tax=Chionoecetes opilio TaxID=41210 RepID=A0A8J4YMA1_CHIOP|nr:Nucleoside diphosphate-linked moiety X motif 17 [Chionoecetes opilio]
MAASSYTRVLVHLRRATQGAAYTCAEFSECVVDALGLDGEGLHPPFCPVQHLGEDGAGSLPPDIAMRGVDVGVAVLLESSDRRLLLTRRAGHMRTFPSIWVPPGGHVEDGESLEEAGLRELLEETGLTVTEEERKSSRVLGLWESVYPPVLGMGVPKRHHVVVYLHITLHKASEQLNKEFELCPEEVDGAAWLSVELIKQAVWSKEQLDQAGIKDSNDHIPITLVSQNGEHLDGTLEASILTRKQEPNQLTLDRISTGSRYALSLWLSEHLEDSGDSGTSRHHLYGKYMQNNTNKPIPDSKY